MYRIKITNSNLKLNSEQVKEVEKVIRDRLGFDESQNLNQMMRYVGLKLKFEGQSVNGLSYEGPMKGYFYDILEYLVPYVPKGTFIEVIDDMGQQLRLIFDGETLRILNPIIIWPHK